MALITRYMAGKGRGKGSRRRGERGGGGKEKKGTLAIFDLVPLIMGGGKEGEKRGEEGKKVHSSE